MTYDVTSGPRTSQNIFRRYDGVESKTLQSNKVCL